MECSLREPEPSDFYVPRVRIPAAEMFSSDRSAILLDLGAFSKYGLYSMYGNKERYFWYERMRKR
jgi:hypothetical protein